MKKILLALFFLLGVFCCDKLSAQNPATFTPDQIRAEVVRRGFDPAEVETRMRARGFDPNNITESQLPAAQQAFLEIIRELENARDSNGRPAQAPSAPPVPEKISPPDQQFPNEPAGSRNTASGPAAIYGQQLFRDRRLSIYRQTSELTVPEDYILGPGDKLVVSIWGQVAAYSEDLEVNSEGYVIPKTLSRVYLTGLTYAQAKGQLQAVFARRYPVDRTNFAVSLSVARTLDVNITGEVFDYGSFRLSALNPAFNALVATGGPTDIGSVRKITLYRSGQAPRRLDVYEYLLDPSGKGNTYLQNGDNIFVPVAERVVEVDGAVRRPARYELIAGEQLRQLLEWAGGLRGDAYTTSIQVARVVNQQRTFLDVNLADLLTKNQDFDLLDGDVVTIRDISAAAENFVNVEGAVDFSGSYAFSKGLKITDLLARARLRKEARTDFAYLQRSRMDGTTEYLSVNLAAALADPSGTANATLQPRDRLIVFAQSRFADAANIQSEGALRESRTLPYDASRTLRVSDLIDLSGGLRPDAADFAYLIRTRPDNPEEKSYIRVNLRAIGANPAAPDNMVLEPFDRLTVQSKSLFSDEYTVQVKGAVRNPGEYHWDQSLQLQDLLSLAGGLRREAASDRVDIFRVVINQNQPTSVVVGTFKIDSLFNVLNNNIFQLQPYDIVVVRSVPEFELQKMVTIRGEVRYPGEYALIDKNEQLLSVLQRAGGLTTEAFPPGATLYRSEGQTGFVVLRLDAVLRDPANRHNFVLKAGDVIDIPKTKDLVAIRGATRAFDLYPDKIIGNNGGINVAYRPGKRAGWYVREYAAGFGERALRRSLTVEEANGRLRRTKNFVLFKIYPPVSKGATINVARKPAPEPKTGVEKKSVDWDVVFAETIAKATSVLTLLVLLQRL